MRAEAWNPSGIQVYDWEIWLTNRDGGFLAGYNPAIRSIDPKFQQDHPNGSTWNMFSLSRFGNMKEVESLFLPTKYSSSVGSTHPAKVSRKWRFVYIGHFIKMKNHWSTVTGWGMNTTHPPQSLKFSLLRWLSSGSSTTFGKVLLGDKKDQNIVLYLTPPKKQ